MKPLAGAWSKLAGLAAIAGCGMVAFLVRPADPLQARMAHIQVPPPADEVACTALQESRTLKLLVIGQSNAGNHLEVRTPPLPTAQFSYRGKCYASSILAPGATGRGGNLWTALGPGLQTALHRPVVFSVIAVDATRIDDWARPGKLNDYLALRLQEEQGGGFQPDLVLWLQGEADARFGTRRNAYRASFETLLRQLDGAGVTAPVMVALSTRCGNEGSAEVRQALADLVQSRAATGSQVIQGPDLDQLVGDQRHDGCHFSVAGTEAAAAGWQVAIRSYLAARQGTATAP